MTVVRKRAMQQDYKDSTSNFYNNSIKDKNEIETHSSRHWSFQLP